MFPIVSVRGVDSLVAVAEFPENEEPINEASPLAPNLYTSGIERLSFEDLPKIISVLELVPPKLISLEFSG